MIDPKELDDVYDKGIGDEDNNEPVKPVRKVTGFNSSAPVPRMYENEGIQHVSPVDARDYTQIPGGAHDYQDIDTQRGQSQSAWDKWANFGVRIVAKTGTALLEGAGNVGSLLFEWGDDRNYDNAVTDLAKSWNLSLDEALPIYKKNQGIWGGFENSAGSGFGDLGWWLNNSEGLISSVAAFALEGAGIAKLVTGIGKVSGLAQGTEALLNSRKFGQVSSQALTASSLAYVEGAQMGKNVFDTVYKTRLQKALGEGKTPEQAHEEAKHIAAQSAATTVQLNTMMGTMTNMYSVLPFFNAEERAVERLARQKFGQLPGESVAAWGARVGGYTADQFKRTLFKGQGKVAMLREAGLEGLEELNNQFAERTGIEQGKQGKTHGILNQLTQLSHWADRTMDAEGGLNFMMGALAGPGTNIVTTNIPIHKIESGYTTNDQGQFLNAAGEVVEKETDAKPMTKVVSSRTKNAYGNTRYFNNIRDAIVEDINFYQNAHAEIEGLTAAGNTSKAEAKRKELFDIETRRSVQLGFGHNLIEQYRQIGAVSNEGLSPIHEEAKVKLTEEHDALVAARAEAVAAGQDPAPIDQQLADVKKQFDAIPVQTEAMRKGLATNADDNAYKEKAEKAIKDINELQKIHDRISSKYSERLNDHDPAHMQLKDFIFERYAGLYLMGEQKKEYEARINELQQQQADLDNVVGGLDLINLVNREREFQRMKVRYDARKAQVEADDKVLHDALTAPTPENWDAAMDIVKKTGTIGVNIHDAANAMASARELLKRQHEEIKWRMTVAVDDLNASQGFSDWLEKNPGKTFKDYTDQIGIKSDMSREEKDLHANLAELEDEISAHAENVKELEKQRTMTSIVKKTKDWWKDLRDEYAAYQVEQATIKKRTANHIARRAKLNLGKMKMMRNDVINEMTNVRDQMNAVAEEIKKWQAYIQTTTSQERWQTFIDRKNKLGDELNVLLNKMEALRATEVELSLRIDAVENGMVVPDADELNADLPDAPDEVDTSTEDEFDDSTEDGPETEAPASEPADEEDGTENEEEADDAQDEFESEQHQQAYAEYKAFVDTLNADAQQYLHEREIELITGTAVNPISLDEMKRYTVLNTLSKGVKGVSQEQAVQVLSLLDRYVKLSLGQIRDADQIAAEAEQAADEVLPVQTDVSEAITSTVVEVKPDTPVLSTVDLDEDALPEKPSKKHRGMKTIEAATTTASSGLMYNELANEEGHYAKESTRQINPNSDARIFSPKHLTAGTKIQMRIDQAYDGPKSNTAGISKKRENEKFDDYLDKDGKIKTDDESIGNVPIQILDESGKPISGMYMRTTRWVLTTYDADEGPEGYRNVYDGSNDPKDPIKPGNAQRQADHLLMLRRQMVALYNAGKKDGVKSTITDKTHGHVIMNMVRDNKTQRQELRWGPASALLPGDLQMAMLVSGALQVDSIGTAPHQNIVSQLPKGKHKENRATFLLPTANGGFHVTIARGTSMLEPDGKPQIALQTLIAAIEGHLTSSAENKYVKSIAENTTFDILHPRGLRDFINQYFTHTERFDAGNVSTEPGKAKYSMDVAKGETGTFTSNVIINHGMTEYKASLKDGKLNPEFVVALKALLATRFRNVVYNNGAIRGINEQVTKDNPFREPAVDNKGRITWRIHKNYNEFIKRHLTVNVNGTNKVKIDGKERYVYSSNPQISYDPNAIMDTPLPASTVTALPTGPAPTQKTSVTFTTPGQVTIYEDGKDVGLATIKYNAENKTAYITDIQIGYDEENGELRNKGIGFEVYKQIIATLAKQGTTLQSTNFAESNSTISPQALRVWEKLFEAGIVGKVMDETTGLPIEIDAKIYDRFNTTEKNDTVKKANLYKAIVEDADKGIGVSPAAIATGPAPVANPNQVEIDRLNVARAEDKESINESIPLTEKEAGEDKHLIGLHEYEYLPQGYPDVDSELFYGTKEELLAIVDAKYDAEIAALTDTPPAPDVQSEFDDAFNSYMPARGQYESSTIENGLSVTDENLNGLVTLAVQSGSYNGRNVPQVRNYLLENDIVSMYKGFNPFIKCG